MLENAGESEGYVSWRRLVDEFEPKTSGRHAALLLDLLKYDFPGDPRTALDEFEIRCRADYKATGEDLAESLKVALVQRGLADDSVRNHLVLHSARLSTYTLVRDEIRNILVTRMALSTEPTPMDIGAVTKGDGKGKKGKKGKKGDGKSGPSRKGDGGKGPKKPDSEVVCFHCH